MTQQSQEAQAATLDAGGGVAGPTDTASSGRAADTEPTEVPGQEPQTDRPADADDPVTLSASPQLVPVSESIRYRRRAQQAERRLAEVQQQLDEQRGVRTSLEAELASTRRRFALTRLLAGRGVVDLEATVVLAEQQLGDADDADPADTVEQLLKDKPYLVGESSSEPRPSSGSEPRPSGRADPRGANPAAQSETNPATQTTMTTPTQGRRGPAGPAEMLRAAARRAASGRSADMDQYLKLRRRFK